MTPKHLPTGATRHLWSVWQRHQGLIVVLTGLSILAGSSHYFLSAALLDGSPDAGSGSMSSSEELRICASQGTMFDGITNLSTVLETFRQRVSAIVEEREGYLRNSARWTCLPLDGQQGANDAPAPAILRALADELPGWSVRTPDGSTMPRPVTFASFASILSEFEREYECKLSEFKEDAFLIVYADQDQATPTGIKAIQADFIARAPAFRSLQDIERQRARIAVERTIQDVRSYELSYTYAKQLVCFQRASLDLKNELSLLADTVSCMPKVWDALTSLHDPLSSSSSSE